tara:strand:- start:4198 stop:4407 length:210 start_codon:yes stop_codon:yes gene_type:complete
MAAPGLGFNIEPVTAATTTASSGFAGGFTTGAFAVGGGDASQSPATNWMGVALVAGAILLLATYLMGRK